MERVDGVRQTDAINTNLNCNCVFVRRGCFNSDRAGDTGGVSIFHRIGDELANDEPERRSLFRRKNAGYWKDAVDRGLRGTLSGARPPPGKEPPYPGRGDCHQNGVKAFEDGRDADRPVLQGAWLSGAEPEADFMRTEEPQLFLGVTASLASVEPAAVVRVYQLFQESQHRLAASHCRAFLQDRIGQTRLDKSRRRSGPPPPQTTADHARQAAPRPSPIAAESPPRRSCDRTTPLRHIPESPTPKSFRRTTTRRDLVIVRSDLNSRDTPPHGDMTVTRNRTAVTQVDQT